MRYIRFYISWTLKAISGAFALQVTQLLGKVAGHLLIKHLRPRKLVERQALSLMRYIIHSLLLISVYLLSRSFYVFP